MGGSGGALRAVQGKTAASRAVSYGVNCGGEIRPPRNHESPVERLFVSTHVRSRSPHAPPVPGPSDPSPACPNRHATAPRFDVHPRSRTRFHPGVKESASAKDLILCLCYAHLSPASTRYPSGGRGITVARVWGGWYDEFIVPTGEPGGRCCCTRSCEEEEEVVETGSRRALEAHRAKLHEQGSCGHSCRRAPQHRSIWEVLAVELVQH